MNVLRTICWLLGVGSVLLVVVGYDALPAEFPVTRWTTSAKTPFLAVRVPLINLASLALVELLATRLRGFEPSSHAATNLYSCLLGTVAAKTVIETVELVWLGGFQSTAFGYGLAAAVLCGISAAGYYFARIDPAHRKELFKTSRMTNILMALTAAAIVLLNLPLVIYPWGFQP